ncbi:gp53-like domain-containing protein [Citrobacter freundii]|uniref:gp53-like domain-containing protein n=1 Tax=Citrobacter freundii TaxID=546 RepID=UPI0020D10975
MAINNFKPFALDPNANVTSQADWEALPALLSGFTAGKASSAQVNKAIRQASFIAAALAQYTANKSRLDVLDDGDLNGFISKMGTAFGKDFQALDATLTALAGLATGANKLPYFTGNDTAAQTDLTSVGRDIIGKNTIADILTYLGLDRINQIPTETIIKLGPDGNKQLFINNGAWGAWDADLNQAIPLSVAQGGIGSTTASGGRANLELGNSSTRNVGTTSGTVMAGDDSRVSTLKTAAYKDIGTGAGQVPDMSSFVSNKSINGRMELPGGVIRQWGVIQVPGNATTEFSFPVPFPSAAYVVVGSFQVPASGSVNMTPLSRTTFNAQNSYATAQYACWIAEGA